MKAKYLFIIIMAFCLGYVFYNYLFHEYEGLTVPVDVESKELYFLQYGAYSTYDNMVKATQDLSMYTYTNDDKYFYAFICITESEENMNKVKGFYEEKGYILYSKKMVVSSSSFLESLSQYDLLLKETTELETIPTICSQGIMKYEEEVKIEN